MKTEEILGLIRTVLAFGGGFMVQKGYIDEATLQTSVGAIIALASAVWSIVDKVRTRATINSLALNIASLQSEVTSLEASDKIDEIQS